MSPQLKNDAVAFAAGVPLPSARQNPSMPSGANVAGYADLSNEELVTCPTPWNTPLMGRGPMPAADLYGTAETSEAHATDAKKDHATSATSPGALPEKVIEKAETIEHKENKERDHIEHKAEKKLDGLLAEADKKLQKALKEEDADGERHHQAKVTSPQSQPSQASVTIAKDGTVFIQTKDEKEPHAFNPDNAEDRRLAEQHAEQHSGTFQRKRPADDERYGAYAPAIPPQPREIPAPAEDRQLAARVLESRHDQDQGEHHGYADALSLADDAAPSELVNRQEIARRVEQRRSSIPADNAAVHQPQPQAGNFPLDAASDQDRNINAAALQGGAFKDFGNYSAPAASQSEGYETLNSPTGLVRTEEFHAGEADEHIDEPRTEALLEIQRRRMERLGGALKQRERGQTTFDDVPNMDSDDADGADAEQERRLQSEDVNKLLAHAPSLPGAKDASDNKPNIGAWQGDTVKAVANTPQRAQRSDALAG
jgi:hypothetical protein